MDDEQDKRAELLKLWHQYGKTYSVFVPAEQPDPTSWDPDVEEFDEKGRVNPHYLKHWKFLSRTKEFLRERYAKCGILQGSTLFFDCLVSEFQKPLRYVRVEGESGPDLFELKDGPQSYQKAIMSSGWHKLYRNMELPLMLVLDEMRRVGIGFDGTGCNLTRNPVDVIRICELGIAPSTR